MSYESFPYFGLSVPQKVCSQDSLLLVSGVNLRVNSTQKILVDLFRWHDQAFKLLLILLK